MSELQWKWVYIPYLDAPEKQEESARFAGYDKVYFKSEADKVISEKDAEIAQLQAMLEERNKQIAELIEKNERLANKDMIMASETIRDVLKQLRHQKYKRCLDKAEMCQAKYDKEDAKVNGRGASWDYTSPEMKYWERWSWRWDTLADKFKEAK